MSKSKINFKKQRHPRDMEPKDISLWFSERTLVELRNYCDEFDYGLDISEGDTKELTRPMTSDILNYVFFTWDKPKNFDIISYCRRRDETIRNSKFNKQRVANHLSGLQKLYYTANPISSIRLLGADIDNKRKNPDLVEPFLDFFQTHYPNSFYDRGSSGKSLHYFAKIDMKPLYDYYQTYDTKNDWAIFANDIYSLTGSIFKSYTNYYIREDKLVHFDAFKGSYPSYKFRTKDGKTKHKELIQNGVLMKVPQIKNINDIIRLRDAPVYSILDHLATTFKLGKQMLLDKNCDIDKKKLLNSLKILNDILSFDFMIFWDEDIKAMEESIKKPVHETPKNPNPRTKLIIPINGDETEESIKIDPDALSRSVKYLYFFYRRFTSIYFREPTFEEFAGNYRQTVGTDIEQPNDRKRLEYVYDRNLPNCRKKLSETYKMRIEWLEGLLDLTDEQIKNMSQNTYNRKIYKTEIAAAGLFYTIHLPQTIVKKHGIQIGWDAGNDHYDRELTAPNISLQSFIDVMYKMEICRNMCSGNNKKSKAIKDILIAIDWIECIDQTYVKESKFHKGRSFRYSLGKSHPLYNNFVKRVGLSIEKWKKHVIERNNRLKSGKNPQ